MKSINIDSTKIYYMRYTAQHKNTHVWDANPLVIFLHVDKKSALGINLHWIPDKYKFTVYSYILQLSKVKINKNIIKYKFKLFYELVKNDKLLRNYAILGIRRYLYSGIKLIQTIPDSQIKNVLKIKKYNTLKMVKR